ncbi:MAG: alpha/beta fold hydrolase BchO [Pseudomonadota bacterium]
MSHALNWEREGLIWPHRDTSEFVRAGGAQWHVQTMGSGPPVLLLHGTGASCHSWRGVMPSLAESHTVIAPDLPRHAFTTGHPPEAMALPTMARAVGRLLDELDVMPAMIVGHSAGAALALQLALTRQLDVPLIGLNAALRPFPGLAAQLFPAFAKMLFVNPLVPRLFSKSVSRREDAERFLARATQSKIDQVGLDCYAALLANSRHTKGALAMMANWDLPALQSRLSAIQNPVLLVHSARDNAVPISAAREAAEALPNAQLEELPQLGHLAHEEDPENAARLIAAFASLYAMRA